MSLFKARNIKRATASSSMEETKDAFLSTLNLIETVPKDEDVVLLVLFYANYSVQYLEKVAWSLEEDAEASQAMKFMNSYIAEAMHLAGLHYYDRERGVSIVDKAIQGVLSNPDTFGEESVWDIIGEIEASYVEDAEDESIN